MLETQRLLLRSIEPRDLDHIHRWKNDPEVTCRLLGRPGLPTRPEIDEWFAAIQQDQRDRKDVRLMIDVIGEESPIGFVGLYAIDRGNQAAEVGILIGDKDSWGMGYAAEAIGGIVAYGQSELDLHRVSLRVRADHQAAIRAYRKCGFVDEGRLRDAWRHDGEYHDVLIMGRVCDE